MIRTVLALSSVFALSLVAAVAASLAFAPPADVSIVPSADAVPAVLTPGACPAFENATAVHGCPYLAAAAARAGCPAATGTVSSCPALRHEAQPQPERGDTEAVDRGLVRAAHPTAGRNAASADRT